MKYIHSLTPLLIFFLFQICISGSFPKLTAGSYKGTFSLTEYVGTDSSRITKNDVIFTFRDTGSFNDKLLYPDSGFYTCSGVFAPYNPPSGGGYYYVYSDSITISDRAGHTAEFDWTLILNGSFGLQIRNDSIIFWQKDSILKRYRYMNLAKQVTNVSRSINTSLSDFELYQNYPNPFNPNTTIRFHIGSESEVTLDIYDVLGRKISNLVHARLSSGMHSVDWNSLNITSGVYWCRIIAGDYSKMIKLVLAK